MKRLLCVTTVLAVCGFLALATRSTGADKEKGPSVEAIMKEAHAGTKSLLGKVRGELEEDSPDWAEVQKSSKRLIVLGGALEKTTPPQGPKDSWQKLTKQYSADVKALDAAAQKKDKDATAAAQMKIGKSCAACHKVHKKPDDD